MIYIFFSFTVFAYLIGFFCGKKKSKSKTVVRKNYVEEELLKLQKEYENFLNYDGTEQ